MPDDQPSPQNPFETASPDLNMPENGAIENELPQGAPGVAANRGKAFMVLGLLLAVVLFLLYNIVFGGKNKPDEEPKPKDYQVQKQRVEPEIPELPSPPEDIKSNPIVPPIVPIPAPPEPAIIPTDILKPSEDNAAKQQRIARQRSTMLVKDGGSGDSGLSAAFSGSPSTVPPGTTDPNSQFAASLVANTKAEQVKAGRIGDLRRTIAQGRIIQATMESALNTDLPAPIRAIVSRDTYAEAGNVPLIPKGSRLIGSYNTSLSSGQTRVFVIWTRVIRPDGVDVMLGSPLVDQIGQAGVAGQVDTKFQEIFSRSLLSSVMNIALAIGSDELAGGSTTTSTNASGTQTTGDAATTATTNALNRLGAVTDGFIQKFLNVAPTILVDQGTPVNVFVNKDIVFPEEAASTARIVN